MAKEDVIFAKGDILFFVYAERPEGLTSQAGLSTKPSKRYAISVI